MQNNPLQFLKLLQDVTFKISNELSQWNCFRQSNRQRKVEAAIIENMKVLNEEYDHYGSSIALSNFLHATKPLTKHIHKALHIIQHSDDNNDIDLSDLLVPDLSTSKNLCTKTIHQKQTMKIQLTPVSNDSFVPKTFTITNEQPSQIGRNVERGIAAPSNLLFNNDTISFNHAEMMINNGRLYIRDLGSEHGTFVNDKRTGRAGVPWTPQLIEHGCHLRLGTIDMILNIIPKVIPTRNVSETETRVTTKTVTVLIENGSDELSIRVIPLRENRKEIIGRSTTRNPPSPHNALIQTSGISTKQVEIWTKNGNVFLKALKTSFPVRLNGVKPATFVRITSGAKLTLGIRENVHVTINFPPDNLDSLPTVSLMPYTQIGLPFGTKNLKFDESLIILLGRETKDIQPSASNGIFSSAAAAISQSHAQFIWIDGEVALVDLCSDSGTFHHPTQGIPTRFVANTPTMIHNGDVIQLGSSHNELHFVKAIVKITNQR